MIKFPNCKDFNITEVTTKLMRNCLIAYPPNERKQNINKKKFRDSFIKDD